MGAMFWNIIRWQNIWTPISRFMLFRLAASMGNILKDQSFEAMVAAHLAELRSLQPEGPYFLGGYCLGGLLALEAAQQLSAAGEEVALVVLIQADEPHLCSL